jgi:hypothetical protein
MMKTISLILASLSILSIATPLAAQTRQSGPAATQPGRGEHRYVARLRRQLNTGIALGAITKREATTLRIDLRALDRLRRTYGRDGFARAERATLRRRGDSLRQMIQRAQDNDSRGAPPTG